MGLTSLATEHELFAWSLESAPAPAFFFVWQDDLADLGSVLEPCQALGIKPLVISADGRGLFERLPLQQLAEQPGMVVVVVGGLSDVPSAARQDLDRLRGRFLALESKLVFAEPAIQEPALRRDYPDLFAVARGSFHFNLPAYENDYLWDSANVQRFDTLVKTLPPMVTRGATIIDRGRPHFKGPPPVQCPKCGTALIPGTTSLTFKHAPALSKLQMVKAWVCSCGESYVPGEAARQAHRAAFGQPASAD